MTRRPQRAFSSFFMILSLTFANSYIHSSTSDSPNRKGFYAGAEWLNCTDLFIHTNIGLKKVEGSFQGFSVSAGYSVKPTRKTFVGWGVALAYMPLKVRDFTFDVFQEEILLSQEKILFSNVRYAMATIDPHLLFRLNDRFTLNLSFMFALVFSHYDYSKTGVVSGNRGGMQTFVQRIGSASKTQFLGGANLGASMALVNPFYITVNYGLFVGRVTSSGYGLYEGSTYLGGTGGGTEYMKIAAVGLMYRF